MKKILTVAAVGLLALSGCAKYYEVEDVPTGKTYITKGDRYKFQDGKAMFYDEKSNNEVVLSDFKRHEISEDTAKLAIKAAAVSESMK